VTCAILRRSYQKWWAGKPCEIVGNVLHNAPLPRSAPDRVSQLLVVLRFVQFLRSVLSIFVYELGKN
jgi:hypothetical protein